MPTAVPNKPSHPAVGRVDLQPGQFSSSYRAAQAFHKDDKICAITGTSDSAKAYTSVQYGIDKHLELNSDLAYINHSCSPNTAFVLGPDNKKAWHLKALSDIAIGDELTFFYPGTEWDMDQPFVCKCGSKICLRVISGAKDLPLEEIAARGYVAPHIRELVMQRVDVDDPEEP